MLNIICIYMKDPVHVVLECANRNKGLYQSAWILAIVKSHIQMFEVAKANECDDCRTICTYCLVVINLERALNV